MEHEHNYQMLLLHQDSRIGKSSGDEEDLINGVDYTIQVSCKVSVGLTTCILLTL